MILFGILYVLGAILIVFLHGVTNTWGLEHEFDRVATEVCLPLFWPMITPVALVLYILYFAHQRIIDSGKSFREKIKRGNERDY